MHAVGNISHVNERLVLSLDVNSTEKAEAILQELSPLKGMVVKVGLEFIYSVGPSLAISLVKAYGFNVFADAKLKDIPNTLAGATKSLVRYGPEFINVYADSSIEGIRAVVDNKERSKVLVVTVPTCLDDNDCHHIYGAPSKAKVLEFARDALYGGADGIICSPQELEMLASKHQLQHMEFVTPGVRPLWAPAHDQKRVMTPAEAMMQGATRVVVGRPITNPPQGITRLQAAAKIIEEISNGLEERKSLKA